KCAY
ncbi:hypothetical protein BVZ79_01034B, partial [Haemophilus influenzae]